MASEAEKLVEDARSQGLTTISLSGRALSHVPPGVSSLSALRSLTVSKNQLVVLPSSLSALPALTALDASFNAISTWEGGGAWLGSLTGLTNLNLMANRLDSVPADELGKLTDLISLGLKCARAAPSHHSLRQLAPCRRQHGTRPHRRSNRLTSLPPTVGKLTKLVHLFLTDNLLETLPIELTGCVSLRKIQAASNRISSVPDGLEAMPELEFMRLPCNRLTVRRAGF